MHRLLVIEDTSEKGEFEPLRPPLEFAGFAVDSVSHSARNVQQACSAEHAGIVFQVIEAGSDLEFVRAVRSCSQVPIVLAGKKIADQHRIVCLESGADEYLSQPFQSRELIARLRSLLRRASASTPVQQQQLTVGALLVDSASRTASLSGTPLALTNVEFSILEVLLRQSGRVVSREFLAQSVLGRTFRHYDRSIDMHVSRVRKKLGDPANGKGVIRTIRNVGYMLTAAVRAEKASGTPSDTLQEHLSV